MNVRRLNLCFNLDNERSKLAYDLLQDQSAKTAYVIEAVLSLSESNKLDKNQLKSALKEVMIELGVEVKSTEEYRPIIEDGIPDDLFDLLSEL